MFLQNTLSDNYKAELMFDQFWMLTIHYLFFFSE